MSQTHVTDTPLAEKYLVERPLGSGACATVYFAQDTRLQRPVALKKLNLPQGLSSQEYQLMVGRFYQEARTAAQLQHPAIVQVLDIFEAAQNHYIAMEYIDGQTLADWFQQPAHRLDDALRVMAQIAAGLAHAHQQQVVHRDIKPENILVNTFNQPKVTDFGVAKIMAHEQQQTLQGSLLGTLGYMSPEQLYDSKQADARSDIYSFGAMMYHLFTGSLPFEADSIGKAIAQVFGGQLILPHQHNPKLPPALSAVIAQALCREPADRYPSMQALQADLDKLHDLLTQPMLQQSLPDLCDPARVLPSLPREQRFADYGLLTLLQERIDQNASCCLAVHGTQTQQGLIAIASGKVQAAVLKHKPDLSPIDALSEMVCWASGYCLISSEILTQQPDFEYMPTDLLIMELYDARQAYQQIVPDYLPLLQHKVSLKTSLLSRSLEHQPHVRPLLQQADGDKTLAQLLSLLPLDRLSILRALVQLEAQQAVEYLPA
ncbi:MAG: serine/threonine protein kinase [Candidatus Sericytochromatia bacterium]|nr:serine/threonine protein kinase [Candidatus Sericytochromatia bacterium]